MNIFYVLFLGALVHSIATYKPSEALKNFKNELSDLDDTSRQLSIIKSKGKMFFIFCFGLPMLSYLIINVVVSYLFSDIAFPKSANTLWWGGIFAITCYIAWAIRDILFQKVSIIGIALFLIIMFGVVNLSQQALFLLIFIGLLRKPISWTVGKVYND